ncbi:OB-fold nucleic acid binding domain-containing protein [Demequina oxidasica]|uniref:OB-fold nucleic acid binding domain-containing protein n=1 Tax=Demequina oxidasica TaxID=676199 RepID=UPI00078293A2|nr:OB-fold nucleic acid binding domain-containing protein [Demequina oxidasica]
MTQIPTALSPISEAQPRTYARVAGRIVWVQVEPSDAAPRLTARIEDQSGRLDAIFQGRRAIAGIEPGRRVVLEGRICEAIAVPLMYNPRYELVASA